MTITQHPSPAGGLDDAFGRVLAVVRDELSSLVDTPAWSLEDRKLDERFAQAVAITAAAEEILSRLAAEMDDRDLPARVGASSMHAHLVGTHRMSRASAGRTVCAARQLHGCRGNRSGITEPVRRAQACGRVSAEQAVTVATAVNQLGPDLPVDRVEAAQADLIRYAGELGFEDLQRVANRVVEVVDPDRADQILQAQLLRQEQAALAGCEFILRIQPDGTGHGRFHHLPAVPTAMLKKALDAITAPRRRPDSALVGETPLDRRLETSPDELPYPNRLGRAFCELVEHLPTDGLPSQGSTAATVVVTIDHTKLRDGLGAATLDTGSDISAGEARRVACNAALLPMVLAGESKVLDLGQSRRLFDRYQRLALAQRDKGCVFPRCEHPAAWCEAHHHLEWARGGPTDLSNGCLLCSFHHHLIHVGDWQIRIAPDGIPEAIPPPWVDPASQPIRHTRFNRRE